MIYYIDRLSGEKKIEKIYGGKALSFLFGSSFLNRLLGRPLGHLIARIPFFSRFYGFCQTLPASSAKIAPFIKKYGVDTSEFLEPMEKFRSFNDFFCRKLKPEKRPIAPGNEIAIIPADGRYLFFPSIEKSLPFLIKGRPFSLSGLLNDARLSNEYEKGSMVLGRLCPTDYHRFHFPCRCIPSPARLLNGPLYSVNPIALKYNFKILSENKRMLCELDTEDFGKILFLEIGATNVGSIHQTYTPFSSYEKGDEKGFFSFGGSAILLLFLPNKIIFDADLLAASDQKIEILCSMGQSMGKKVELK